MVFVKCLVLVCVSTQLEVTQGPMAHSAGVQVQCVFRLWNFYSSIFDIWGLLHTDKIISHHFLLENTGHLFSCSTWFFSAAPCRTSAGLGEVWWETCVFVVCWDCSVWLESPPYCHLGSTLGGILILLDEGRLESTSVSVSSFWQFAITLMLFPVLMIGLTLLRSVKKNTKYIKSAIRQHLQSKIKIK